jgi:hypothetical protein
MPPTVTTVDAECPESPTGGHCWRQMPYLTLKTGTIWERCDFCGTERTIKEKIINSPIVAMPADCHHSPNALHCWHGVPSDPSGPYKDVRRCCHCGVEEVRTFPAYWPSQHGPHAPKADSGHA